MMESKTDALYLQRDYIISILLFLKQYKYVYIVSKMCTVQLRIYRELSPI